jgi:hypothetical protein
MSLTTKCIITIAIIALKYTEREKERERERERERVHQNIPPCRLESDRACMLWRYG